MAIRSWCSVLVISTVALLLGSSPLAAQTQFASFTGTVTSTDGNPVPGVDGRRHQRGDAGHLHRRQQRAGALHDRRAPDRHLQGPRGRRRTSGPSRPTRSSSNRGRPHASTSRCTVGATEKVEVTGVTPILQTQDAVVGEVISQTTIERMPLNGRNFSQLSLLLPGRHDHRARHLHRAEELRPGPAVSSTASASRATTSCSMAWT